jgi:hypothetical protein
MYFTGSNTILFFEISVSVFPASVEIGVGVVGVQNPTVRMIFQPMAPEVSSQNREVF